MKKIMIIFFGIFLTYTLNLFSLPASTTIYVYGKGGVIQRPDGTIYMCPISDPAVCAIIKTQPEPIPGEPGNPVFKGLMVNLCYNNEVFRNIIIVEQPNWSVLPNGEGYIFYGVNISCDEVTKQRLIELGEPTTPTNCEF